MDNGWIKLHRRLKEWEWYSDINTKVLFIELLLSANHKPARWRGQLVESGQLITGRESLSKSTGLTVQQIRTSLIKLKSTSEITIKSTNQYSLIQLNNWDDHQLINQQDNKRVTSNQPASNHKQEGKKDKNKRNNTDEKNIFDSFRKKYEGTKRGLNEEFLNFCNKHKDWKEVLPLLEPALWKQIEFRRRKEGTKEFVPGWKNLSTWINQRCWTEEISESKTEAPWR